MKANLIVVSIVVAVTCSALAIENGDFFYGDANWSVYLGSVNCSVTFYPDPYPDPYVRVLGARGGATGLERTAEIYQAETGFSGGETWRATFVIKSLSGGAGSIQTIGWTDDSGDFGAYGLDITSAGTYDVDCDNPAFSWVTVHAQGSAGIGVDSIIQVDEISTLNISGVTPTPTATPTPTLTVTPTPAPTPSGCSLLEDWVQSLPGERLYAVAYNSTTNHLLLAASAPSTMGIIRICDADTGTTAGPPLQNPSTFTDTELYFALTVAEDGQIYASELLGNVVYRWDNESVAPVQINVAGGVMMTIRCMRAYGSGINTVILATGDNDNGPIEKWTTSDPNLIDWTAQTLTGCIAKTGVSGIPPELNTVYGIQPWGLDETNPNEGFPERFDLVGTTWVRSATFAPQDIAPGFSSSYSVGGDYADGVLWVLYYFHNLSGEQYQDKDIIWGLDATTGAMVAEYIIPENISHYGSVMADPSHAKIYWGARTAEPGTETPQSGGIYGCLSYDVPCVITPTPTVTPPPTPSPTPYPPGNYFTLSTDWLTTQPFTIIPQAAYNPATHHLLVNTESQIIVYDAETGQDTGGMLQDHPDHSEYFSVACAEDGTIYATEFWQYGWLYRWEDEWSSPSLQIIPDLVYVTRNINVRGTGVNTRIYATGGDDNSCIQILRTADGLNFHISDTVSSPAAKSDVGVKDENTVYGIQAWGSLDGDYHSRDFPARFDKIGDTWVRSSTFQAADMMPYPAYYWSYSLAGDWADGVLWTLYFIPSTIAGLNGETGEKVAQWDCPYDIYFWAGLDVDPRNRKIYFGATLRGNPFQLIGRLSYDLVTSSTAYQTEFDTGSEQWSSGPSASFFTLPTFTATSGALSITTHDNTNTFGFWQSPDELFTPCLPMMYRVRARVSSDVSSWDQAPALRLRVSRRDFQQTDFLVANNLQPQFGGFASTLLERAFDLYFTPSECPSSADSSALSVAFDVLGFDPTRAPDATVNLESLEITELSPGLLGSPLESREFTFETGAEGWEFSGTIAPFTPPLFLAADGALTLTAINNSDTFAFWQSPQDAIPIAESSLCRAVFTVSADSGAGNAVPTLRFRVGSRFHQVVAGKQIDSVGNGLNAPTTVARDISVYFVAPESAAEEDNNLLLAWDVLNFDPDNNINQTVRVHNVRVERLALPPEFFP